MAVLISPYQILILSENEVTFTYVYSDTFWKINKSKNKYFEQNRLKAF